jgi:hypothetical protein
MGLRRMQGGIKDVKKAVSPIGGEERRKKDDLRSQWSQAWVNTLGLRFDTVRARFSPVTFETCSRTLKKNKTVVSPRRVNISCLIEAVSIT